MSPATAAVAAVSSMLGVASGRPSRGTDVSGPGSLPNTPSYQGPLSLPASPEIQHSTALGVEFMGTPMARVSPAAGVATTPRLRASGAGPATTATAGMSGGKATGSTASPITVTRRATPVSGSVTPMFYGGQPPAGQGFAEKHDDSRAGPSSAGGAVQEQITRGTLNGESGRPSGSGRATEARKHTRFLQLAPRALAPSVVARQPEPFSSPLDKAVQVDALAAARSGNEAVLELPLPPALPVPDTANELQPSQAQAVAAAVSMPVREEIVTTAVTMVATTTTTVQDTHSRGVPGFSTECISIISDNSTCRVTIAVMMICCPGVSWLP
ncbi:hypothetical protein V8C86DRAFT_2509789 [Haematococcus lacustris]